MRYVIPLISGIILALVCLAPDTEGHRQTAKLLSGPIYRADIALGGALLLFTARQHFKQRLWQLLDLSICCSLLILSLHLLIHLPRPLRHGHGFSPGFPSGHTTLVFGLAWLILESYPQVSALWFGVAIAIGWSRIALHSHFPYQVFCGGAFGVALGWWVSHSPRGVILPRCLCIRSH
jgi:membrane-associated phospholipid phosphatase